MGSNSVQPPFNGTILHPMDAVSRRLWGTSSVLLGSGNLSTNPNGTRPRGNVVQSAGVLQHPQSKAEEPSSGGSPMPINRMDEAHARLEPVQAVRLEGLREPRGSYVYASLPDRRQYSGSSWNNYNSYGYRRGYGRLGYTGWRPWNQAGQTYKRLGTSSTGWQNPGRFQHYGAGYGRGFSPKNEGALPNHATEEIEADRPLALRRIGAREDVYLPEPNGDDGFERRLGELEQRLALLAGVLRPGDTDLGRGKGGNTAFRSIPEDRESCSSDSGSEEQLNASDKLLRNRDFTSAALALLEQRQGKRGGRKRLVAGDEEDNISSPDVQTQLEPVSRVQETSSVESSPCLGRPGSTPAGRRGLGRGGGAARGKRLKRFGGSRLARMEEFARLAAQRETAGDSEGWEHYTQSNGEDSDDASVADNPFFETEARESKRGCPLD